MACTYSTLRHAGLNHMRLIGFDSFEGMPSGAEKEGWFKGQYHSSMQATRSYLKRKQVDLERVTLVKGWFKDTLTEETRRNHSIEKASLIMVDCDIYSASKDALNFCEPHIHKQAVIMFDDWGWREEINEIGQKEAFEEFLAEHPELIVGADALIPAASGAGFPCKAWNGPSLSFLFELASHLDGEHGFYLIIRLRKRQRLLPSRLQFAPARVHRSDAKVATQAEVRRICMGKARRQEDPVQNPNVRKNVRKSGLLYFPASQFSL